MACLFALTIFQGLTTFRAHAVDPDTFSPVVSYQYLDSLADSGTTVVSPVVSYQYYDWPGDENLTFTNSPSVSYYFSGGVVAALTGTIRTTLGVPVAGATISLKRYGTVFWTGSSDANGNFYAPGLLGADYVAAVTKPGYVTATTNVRGDAGGSLALNVELAEMPPPLPTVDVNDAPAPTAIRDPGPGTAHLRVLKGGQFTVDFTYDSEFDPSRQTIVLSHGWLSGVDRAGESDWVKPMALEIRNRIASSAANIVAWDWSGEANRGLVGGIDVAAVQGEHLGKALREKLGVAYGSHLHFIGHSFGTIVNANACDYVHGSFPRNSMNPASPWVASQTQPHVTLMDEAEVASVFGQNVATAAALGWKVAQLKGALLLGGTAAVANWKEPIPRDAYWIDNYISAVGLKHDEAVNVCLVTPTVTLDAQTLQSLTDGILYGHGYAHSWYRNTIPLSGVSAPIGFGSSLESGASFPPSGTGTTDGSLWWENIDTPDVADISLTRPDLGGLVDVSLTGDFPILFGLSVVAGSQLGDRFIGQPLDALGQSVLDGYEMGIQFAGNVGGTVIYTTGVVYTETKEKVGLWWDAAQDEGSDILNSLDPAALITGPLAAPVFKIRLKTQAAPQQLVQPAKGRTSSAGLSATGQPAYAWVNVAVPADAGLMAFDFTVSGDPAQDLIACAINEQNVFTLPARFAPDGQTVSTDLIDVSAHAGQTVELFFGLTGSTSTDCEVAIDGVRFITVPTPKLAIGAAGPGVVLKWPAAATGWVVETSDSLAPGSWQEVAFDTEITVDRGVATMVQPASGPKRFYRLRRNP